MTVFLRQATYLREDVFSVDQKSDELTRRTQQFAVL